MRAGSLVVIAHRTLSVECGLLRTVLSAFSSTALAEEGEIYTSTLSSFSDLHSREINESSLTALKIHTILGSPTVKILSHAISSIIFQHVSHAKESVDETRVTITMLV